MTNFEKSVKRGMTREQFEKIRDQPYGDGKTFLCIPMGMSPHGLSGTGTGKAK